MNALCEDAYQPGITIVAARRNMPLQDEGFPAALIPCVGVDNEGEGPEGGWLYRNDTIEYSAHGVNVPVAAHGGGHTTMTGTSFATPIMCGFVALLLGAYPGLRPFEVKALLKALAGGAGELTGFGLSSDRASGRADRYMRNVPYPFANGTMPT